MKNEIKLYDYLDIVMQEHQNQQWFSNQDGIRWKKDSHKHKRKGGRVKRCMRASVFRSLVDDKLTNKQTHRQTQTDRQTNRQTDRDRQADRLTN